MRKTNNRINPNNSNVFWTVYDQSTDEYLTRYDSCDIDECSWASIIVEEGVGDLERLGTSARFDSEEDARTAAEFLVEKIREINPGDDVELHLVAVTTVMTEMVAAVDFRSGPASYVGEDEDEDDYEEEEEVEEEQEEDDLDLEEDEEYLEAQWSRHKVEAKSPEPQFPEVKAPKKAKVKKSAKSRNRR